MRHDIEARRYEPMQQSQQSTHAKQTRVNDASLIKTQLHMHNAKQRQHTSMQQQPIQPRQREARESSMERSFGWRIETRSVDGGLSLAVRCTMSNAFCSLAYAGFQIFSFDIDFRPLVCGCAGLMLLYCSFDSLSCALAVA
jgi:hypothetical protein